MSANKRQKVMIRKRITDYEEVFRRYGIKEDPNNSENVLDLYDKLYNLSFGFNSNRDVFDRICRQMSRKIVITCSKWFVHIYVI